MTLGRGAAGAGGGVPAGAQRAQHAAVAARGTPHDEVDIGVGPGPVAARTRTRRGRDLLLSLGRLRRDAASRRGRRRAGGRRGVRRPARRVPAGRRRTRCTARRSRRPISTAAGCARGAVRRPDRWPQDVLADLEPGLRAPARPRAGGRPGGGGPLDVRHAGGSVDELREWLRLRPGTRATTSTGSPTARWRCRASRRGCLDAALRSLPVTRRLGVPALLAAPAGGCSAATAACWC